MGGLTRNTIPYCKVQLHRCDDCLVLAIALCPIERLICPRHHIGQAFLAIAQVQPDAERNGVIIGQTRNGEIAERCLDDPGGIL